jgi:hypothetical protein
MAQGQTTGAHGRTRRVTLPRVGSMEGNFQRAQRRANTTPSTSDKFRGGFKVAGSRNPRKVGRG